MNVPAKTRAGETLTLIAFDGKLFQLESERAYAPGTPMQLELELVLGSSVGVELKSIGSVKLPSGKFLIKARAATLTRQAQEGLARVFGG